MPYSSRIVCGCFNVPQLFTTRVVRRDLRLIVLYPRRLESLTIADAITKAALSTQLF